ncbi:MAG: hypothetical protein GY842_12445, partial [bacterium]|nr:hypothetical protein [bacterium]
AGGVGLALWAARRLARRWIDPRPGRALSFVGAMVVGGSVAVIAYGVRSGSLPGTSLSFRWDYWTAAADLVGDHLWTGVGRENFGDAYLGYKSIESPEEVQNPHNFLVAAAADWGVIGLAGVVVMLVGGAVAVAGPTLRRRGEPPPDDGADAAATARTLLPWGLLLGLVTFGVRLGLLGSDNPHYLYVATVLPGGLWLLGFGVCAIAWGDPRDTGGLRDSRMGVVLACGLFAFLLQDTINFALYVPGAATPFFGLVGVAVAARRLRGADVAPHPRARWLPAGLVGVGLAVMMVLVLVLPPVWGASEALGQARTLSYAPIDGAVEDHPAYRSYELAAEADPLDPTAPKELADWLARSAAVVSEPIPLLRLALAGIDEAIARSPSRVAFHRRRARIALSLSRWTDDPADRAAALESAARAIVLYPTRPDSLVELADLQVWVSREEGRPELSRASLDNFRRALEVDSRRPEWEEIRRFRPSRIAEIEAKIEAVEAELGEPPN